MYLAEVNQYIKAFIKKKESPSTNSGRNLPKNASKAVWNPKAETKSGIGCVDL